MRAVRSPRRENGQTMAEYAVMLAVITPAIVLSISLLSGRVQARVEQVIGFFS
jgi:Flp pilus assembly pilin Flp